jgi:hypothetical protein
MLDETRVKIDRWVVVTATMNESVRRNSMLQVAAAHLRKTAQAGGLDDYRPTIESVQTNPAQYDALTDMEREIYDLAMNAGLWAAVAGCVKPYIKLDEWLALPAEIVEALSSAANDKNPHWFDQPNQEKKTDE